MHSSAATVHRRDTDKDVKTRSSKSVSAQSIKRAARGCGHKSVSTSCAKIATLPAVRLHASGVRYFSEKPQLKMAYKASLKARSFEFITTTTLSHKFTSLEKHVSSLLCSPRFKECYSLRAQCGDCFDNAVNLLKFSILPG